MKKRCRRAAGVADAFARPKRPSFVENGSASARSQSSTGYHGAVSAAVALSHQKTISLLETFFLCATKNTSNNIRKEVTISHLAAAGPR